MNEKQMQAARDAMIEWLEHPHELGAAPAEIECAGTFELHDMTYYLFRYRREADGDWLLGVCGGYEDGDWEHCGHVYSEMEEYDESTAVEKATAMVELIRTYWMEQAKLAEERKDLPLLQGEIDVPVRRDAAEIFADTFEFESRLCHLVTSQKVFGKEQAAETYLRRLVRIVILLYSAEVSSVIPSMRTSK